MNSPADEKIINSFLEGKTEGLLEPGFQPEHIQTMISHVFLFPKTVYKFYRKDNENFNKMFVDLSGEARKKFYEDDFFYNHYFNPNVYQKLLGINVDEEVHLAEVSNQIYDRVIQMARLALSHNLTTQLLQGSLKEADFRKIGLEMTKMIAEFPHPLKTKKNYYEIMFGFIKDVEGWTYLADPLIPKKEAEEIMDAVYTFLEQRRDFFSQYTEKDFVVAIDNHSDNIFYDNDEVSFIDVFLPKESWRIVMPFYSSSRPALDVLVLSGQRNSDAMLRGYYDYYGDAPVDPKLYYFYMIYHALVKGPYLLILAKEGGKRQEEGMRYWDFIKSSISKIG